MLTTTRVKRYTSQAKNASLIHKAASGLVFTGLLGLSLPSVAVTIPTSSNSNDYRNCASRLERTQVSAEAAASACAGALNPPDVSRCVSDIEEQTEITAPQALESCRQVRRPIELSSCVVGISDNIEGSLPGVLDYCTRSLLPERYAQCVVGLGREINIAPPQALETCISASDRPLDFSPNFIPQGQLQPEETLTPTQPQPQNQTLPPQQQQQSPPTEQQNNLPPDLPATAPSTP